MEKNLSIKKSHWIIIFISYFTLFLGYFIISGHIFPNNMFYSLFYGIITSMIGMILVILSAFLIFKYSKIKIIEKE